MSRQLSELARTAAERSRPRISVDRRVMAGRPCVAGTRIPVQSVLNRLADAPSSDTLLEEHPELTVEDVQACLAHAYVVLDLLGDAVQDFEDAGYGPDWTEPGRADGQRAQERENDADDGEG